MISLKPDIIRLFKLKEKYQGWETFDGCIIEIIGQIYVSVKFPHSTFKKIVKRKCLFMNIDVWREGTVTKLTGIM
jgi:hypothetical protein